MTNHSRARRLEAGLCANPGCEASPMEGRRICKACAKKATADGKNRRARSGKAIPDPNRPMNRHQRAAAGVFVGGKSYSARTRGKAPIAPVQMERSKFEDYFDQGAQLHDLRVTPLDEIAEDHQTRRPLKPKEPNALRKAMPQRVPVGPQTGGERQEEMPKSSKAEFVKRESIGVVLL